MWPLLVCFSSLISPVYGSAFYVYLLTHIDVQYPAAFVPILYAHFPIHIFATFYVTIVVWSAFRVSVDVSVRQCNRSHYICAVPRCLYHSYVRFLLFAYLKAPSALFCWFLAASYIATRAKFSTPACKYFLPKNHIERKLVVHSKNVLYARRFA